jgi:PAS domain S-box-containing protein
MKFRSIRKKIIVTIAIVLFINSIIIISSIAFITYQKMDKQKKEYLTELAIEKARKVNIYLKSSSDFAEYLSTVPEIIKWTEAPDNTNISKALDFLNSINIRKNYSALYVLNPQGVAIISTEPNFTGNNYSFRPYFQDAISGKPSMYVATGATSNSQGYYFSEPIRNDNSEIIGVLVLKLIPDKIYEIFDNENDGKESHIMLTDSYGVVIYSDSKDRVLKSLGTIKPEILTKIKNERKFLGTDILPLQYQEAEDSLLSIKRDKVKIYNFFDKQDLENEIITTAPINNYPLFLVIEDNVENIGADALSLTTISGLIILFSKLLILLVLSILIYKNLKPLKELEKMAKNISEGDLEIENKINSGDEIEKLGISLAKTSTKLKNYYRDLEKNVAERTKELNDKNTYLNNTKLATLNILDDIQEEKNKTDLLAKDLEKFKLALDNASDHIIITDVNGTVLYGNSGVERITGYTLSESIGKKAGKLWSAPMPKEYYAKMWQTIKEDKKTFIGELKNKRKNGEIYDALVSISPVLNNKNEVEFFIGIERDITHEKEVDRAKTEFVSLASHQLRTPLSSVNWYAEMLLAGDGGKLNDEQISFVKEIYAGNQRMVELVNSLLNVSRLELGTFAVEPEPTDVIKMAEDVIKEQQPGIAEKKHKIIFEHAEGVPIIQADPKLFRIVFQNLLSNAIKYTPESGLISLKISNNKKNLLVEISDNGYGIPKTDQPKIFEKLFRAENVREKDTEGTGLGLYIIKSIIDHAGGKITFKSEENKGTTFNLEIPLSGMKKKEGTKKIE